MIILGIWDGHDSSAALLIDGLPVAALAEERPSRNKMKRGFPSLAVAALLEYAKLSPSDVDLVTVAGRYGRAPLRLLDGLYAQQGRGPGPMGLGQRMFRHYENLTALLPGFRELESQAGAAALRRNLQRDGMPADVPVRLFPHHHAHALTAASLSRDDALVLTMDGYGDGLCAGAWRKTNGRLLSRKRWSYLASIAVTYGAVCQCLGFREGDEGKVTALAAAGDHTMLAPFFRTRLRRRLARPGGGPLAAREAGHLAKHRPEDVAAGLQRAVEEHVTALLKQEYDYAPFSTLSLAGGLFANVALNRAILKSLPDTEIQVFPAMGDQGLSLGAAMCAHLEQTGEIAHFDGPFLGPAPDTETIGRILHPRAADRVSATAGARACARVLAGGGTVAVVRGRDEFGPRALGHRSLLFPATGTTLADRVQGMLHRNAIMPFAPVCRTERLDELFAPPYPAPSRKDRGLGWMTSAVAARPRTRREYPAAVHIDGTARVQAATEDACPAIHSILGEYERLTGHGLLINTSFNMHNEPIVHAASDALVTFDRSGVDLMWLGDYLVEREGERT